jgi:hypothetical protein
VLLTDGRVGFIDTTSDPNSIESTPQEDLYTLVESLLVNDQQER